MKTVVNFCTRKLNKMKVKILRIKVKILVNCSIRKVKILVTSCTIGK